MRWDLRGTKERLHARLKRLKAVKVWQLVILLLLSMIVSATLLRLNSLNMSDLRHAVITADEKGDLVEINKAVSRLGTYVTTHMNTDLGDGFYLSSSFERAREAAIAAAAASPDMNSHVYKDASVACQSAAERGKYGGYVPCVQSKVRDVGGSDTLVSELKLPRSETYKIDFVSPRWSLDPAGVSVAISALIVLLIIFRITGAVVLRILLKRRYNSI